MSEHLQTLSAFLSAELDLLNLVQESIEREHEALLKNHIEMLERATESKARTVDRYQQQQLLRSEWMAALGFAADLPLLELMRDLADSEKSPEFRTDSSVLEDVARSLNELALSCDSKNRRNGRLILRLQEKTRNTLNVLRGEDNGKDLYSDSGEKAPSTGSRSLGKA
ncbi:MAG: flagellar protein FlgN [Pseudomonadota bacterium]